MCLGTLVQDGLAHMRGVTWQAVPAKFKTGMCEMNNLKFVVCFRTLVQDGLAHMCGVIWGAAPAKFKTGMCEMKIFGSEICSVSWDVGSGWVGSHAWCNMASCSGKVQNRDV